MVALFGQGFDSPRLHKGPDSIRAFFYTPTFNNHLDKKVKKNRLIYRVNFKFT